MIANLYNGTISWSRRLSLIGLVLVALIFLVSTAVHIATLLGIHVEQYFPSYLFTGLIFVFLIVPYVIRVYESRKGGGGRAVLPPVWVASRRLQNVLKLLYLVYLVYALGTVIALWGSGPDLAESALRQLRRDSAMLMGLSLAGLVNLAELALGWQVLGPGVSGELIAEQKRQANWYLFGLAVIGFGASLLVYGMSFWGFMPEPLWLAGWFAIGAVLLACLGYLLIPQAPEPYPVRPALPRGVYWAGQLGIVLLLMNIALSVFMVFLSGGLLGALRITEAIFLLVYFAVGRVIAAYRLGWPDLMPSSAKPDHPVGGERQVS